MKSSSITDLTQARGGLRGYLDSNKKFSESWLTTNQIQALKDYAASGGINLKFDSSKYRELCYIAKLMDSDCIKKLDLKSVDNYYKNIPIDID